MTYFFCREDLQLFLEFKFLHTRHAVRRSPCFSRTRRNYSQKGYRSFLCVVLRSFVSFIFPSDQVSCPACIQSIFPLPPPSPCYKSRTEKLVLSRELALENNNCVSERMRGSCKHLSIVRCALDIVCFLANKEVEKG